MAEMGIEPDLESKFEGKPDPEPDSDS